MLPTISICIPTYQGEKYLQEALDSASAVSGNDVEIVVCDDSSRDMTVSIILDHQRRDSRLRFIQNPMNLGLVGNWNSCIQHARGEWIKFIFQDDYLLPAFEKSIRPYLSQANDFIATARLFRFEDDASPEVSGYLSQEQFWLNQICDDGETLSSEDFCSTAVQMFGYNFIGEPSNVMFRRRSIFKVGAFNPQLCQYPDLEFYYRLAGSSGVLSLNTPCNIFRVHGQSTTSKNRTQSLQSEDLDLLILFHEALFHPGYNTMRESALNLGISWNISYARRIARLKSLLQNLQPLEKESCERLFLAFPDIREAM